MAALLVMDSGLEVAARKVRYNFFRELARAGRVTKIVTAHTLDDQAETGVMCSVRGNGIRGLSGIHARLVFEGKDEVVRPLLNFRRTDLEAFLRDRGQQWREDSSNRDLAFLRNRLRHRLLPLLKEDFGLAAVENLADLAEIARAEEENWRQIQQDMPAFSLDSEDRTSLPLEPGLFSMPLAAQRRSVLSWLEAIGTNVPISF